MPATKRLVFYVDDDMDDIELVKEALGRRPEIEFKPFTCATDLLESMGHPPEGPALPSLIVVDMNMPGIDGRDLIRILKTDDAWKRIPVTVFSTSNNPDDVAFATRFHARFVTKPLTLTQLSKVVDGILQYDMGQGNLWG